MQTATALLAFSVGAARRGFPPKASWFLRFVFWATWRRRLPLTARRCNFSPVTTECGDRGPKRCHRDGREGYCCNVAKRTPTTVWWCTYISSRFAWGICAHSMPVPHCLLNGVDCTYLYEAEVKPRRVVNTRRCFFIVLICWDIHRAPAVCEFKGRTLLFVGFIRRTSPLGHSARDVFTIHYRFRARFHVANPG